MWQGPGYVASSCSLENVTGDWLMILLPCCRPKCDFGSVGVKGSCNHLEFVVCCSIRVRVGVRVRIMVRIRVRVRVGAGVRVRVMLSIVSVPASQVRSTSLQPRKEDQGRDTIYGSRQRVHRQM